MKNTMQMLHHIFAYEQTVMLATLPKKCAGALLSLELKPEPLGAISTLLSGEMPKMYA